MMPSRYRGNRFLRSLQATVHRLRRRGISLRTQLILLLGVLVLLATASLVWIAYRTSRTIVERAAVREAGITATARKQVLLRVLRQQRVRADALLKTADLGCSPDETSCLRKLLVDFVATEGASAARLVHRGYAPATAGSGAAGLASVAVPLDSEIVHFEFDPSGQPYYFLQVTSQDGRSTLTIRGDMQIANQIFLDPDGLGLSGETFLTDDKGFFLTPSKHPSGSAERQPITGEPIQTCLAGKDGEVLAQGYQGTPVIYGFRHVPEIGGGCIMAVMDQTEAFAPARSIEREVAGVSALMAILAIGYSVVLAQLVSRPMKRLTRRARSLQDGDFDSPVPVEGPTEVRMFARTFEAMALSLKNSRGALQESSEQITNILEGIGDGFAAFDRQWRCTYVNDKAIELSRIPRSEILGKHVWDLLPNGANMATFAALRRAMKERSPLHFEEHYAPFDIWFEVDAYPIRDGLAVLGRDITERRRFTEQLQQTQKLESLGVLAGGIAHDFNNLLTGIMGNASIALEELPSNSPLRHSLDAVVDAAERAAILTRQLLAYAGKGRFVIEPLSLSDLVGEISNLLRTSIPRTVQLRLRLEDGLPCVEGDAAQIQQLIMNLVMNAAEASADGIVEAVRITTGLVEMSQAEIDQMVAPNGIPPGRYVMLEVRDAGSGMDEATLSRIFDPFFTTKFTGRGLGLAAALGIVRGHKGALHVESAPGKGSCFKVLFQPSGGRPHKKEESGSERNLAGSGLILVIDDEEAVLETAKGALELFGYNVLVAADGREGVNCFRENSRSITAVLLDMTMPVMSGEEALMHLKTIRPDVPVVLSSGYDEDEATRRFTGKGLAGFVQKPYTAAALAEKMQSVIQQSRRAARHPA